MSGFMKFGGQIRFPIMGDAQMSVDKLLTQFERQLAYEGANDLKMQGDVITFSGAWFRFRLTGRFLKGIDRGFIRVFLSEQKLVVSYRLSFTRLFYWALFSSLFVSLIIGMDASIVSTLKIFLFLLGILLGLNLVSTLISIRVFIRSIWSAIFRESLFWKILYVIAS